MRLLGFAIANGFSPENRAFANLLARRHDAYDARVVHHAWSDDTVSAGRFAGVSGVPITRYDFGWRPNLDGRRPRRAKARSALRLAMSLAQLPARVARWKPDIIYSSAQKWDCLVAAWVARRLHVPHVVHLHYPIGWWLGRATLWELRRCAHVVAVSDFIRSEALAFGIPKERISVIRNPFPLPEPRTQHVRDAVRAELRVPSDASLVGMVARLDRSKGQLEAVQAFGRAARQLPQAWLMFAGGPVWSGGMQVSELRAAADATGYGDRVLTLGSRSDVPRLLAAMDVFVHPSRQDASPYAVIEASASELPVVGWADGGVAEIVADRETGLLAPVDDVDALGECIHRLVADPELARRMGRAGRERIRALFDPDRSGSAFASLLRATAGRSGLG